MFSRAKSSLQNLKFFFFFNELLSIHITVNFMSFYRVHSGDLPLTRCIHSVFLLNIFCFHLGLNTKEQWTYTTSISTHSVHANMVSRDTSNAMGGW